MSGLANFFFAVVGLTLLPGATTMLVIRRAMMGGARASGLTILGGSLGIYVHALVAAIGLSAIFRDNPTLRLIVRDVGAAYLIWLGAKSILRAIRFEPRAIQPTQGAIASAGRQALSEGLLTVLLSPESALFYLSALSQFIAPDEWALGKALALASVHVLVRIVWYSCLALFVDRLVRVLSQPIFQRGLLLLTAVFLIAFAVRMALA
jgi:threonine/homoserine/homoserine lactone efflux protein